MGYGIPLASVAKALPKYDSMISILLHLYSTAGQYDAALVLLSLVGDEDHMQYVSEDSHEGAFSWVSGFPLLHVGTMVRPP